MVIPAIYEEYSLSYFNDGLAVVKLGGKSGYINTDGEWFIPPRFDYASEFDENGVATVRIDGKEDSLIDRTGTEVTSPGYDFYGPYSKEGLGLVSINGNYGFIDRTGKMVIPAIYEDASNFEDSGLAQVKIDGKYGFIDSEGKTVIPMIFDQAIYVSMSEAQANLFVMVKFGDKLYPVTLEGEFIGFTEDDVLEEYARSDP